MISEDEGYRLKNMPPGVMLIGFIRLRAVQPLLPLFEAHLLACLVCLGGPGAALHVYLLVALAAQAHEVGGIEAQGAAFGFVMSGLDIDDVMDDARGDYLALPLMTLAEWVLLELPCPQPPPLLRAYKFLIDRSVHDGKLSVVLGAMLSLYLTLVTKMAGIVPLTEGSDVIRHVKSLSVFDVRHLLADFFCCFLCLGVQEGFTQRLESLFEVEFSFVHNFKILIVNY